MKKLSALLLVFAMLFVSIPVMAEGEAQIPERVEISFRVGDETLMINGSAVTVEKPYVVGVGVTLVPLRVITEAFGATVEWIAETKSIKLTYPDVNILLQIDNPIAEVNGIAQELLSAPELTPTGFTMVPLRFISETFGADVSYDDATKSIVVVKESVQSEGETVSGGISEKYIGDSYYGWSMENSSELVMGNRSFDGSETEFAYGENVIIVYVDPIDENYDFEKDYVDYKTYYSDGNTLVKADKDSENKKMHFQYRNNNGFGEDITIVTEKYMYTVQSIITSADTQERNDIFAITSTFSVSYPENDVYDLSNAKDGMRKYTSENLNYTILVPDTFTLSSEDGIGNTVVFNSIDDESLEGMNVSVYSKSDVGSAKELCEAIYKTGEYFNELIYSAGSIAQKTYGEKNVFEFDYTLEATSMTVFGKDICFEIGDYVYNVGIMVENNSEAYPVMDKVFTSFEATALDANEIGILMYDSPVDSEQKYTTSGKGWSFEVPYSYIERGKSDNATTLVNRETGVIISLQTSVPEIPNGRRLSLNDVVNVVTDRMIEEGFVLESNETLMLDNVRFESFMYSLEYEGEKIYQNIYIAYDGTTLYSIYAVYTEIFYSEAMKNQVAEIINSFKKA